MMRIDDAEMITLFGVTQRLNVWTSLLLLVAALVIFVLLSRKPRTPETDSVYLSSPAPQAETDPKNDGDASAASGNSGTGGVNTTETGKKKMDKNVSGATGRVSVSENPSETGKSSASGTSGTTGPADSEGK